MSSIWQTKNHQVICRVSFLFDKLGQRLTRSAILILNKAVGIDRRERDGRFQLPYLGLMVVQRLHSVFGSVHSRPSTANPTFTRIPGLTPSSLATLSFLKANATTFGQELSV